MIYIFFITHLAFFFFSGCVQKRKKLSDIFLKYDCDASYCLLMIGSDKCSSSNRFKDYFLKNIIMPLYVKKYYIDIGKISKGNFFYATPFFVLYKGAFPIDVGVGVVNLRNSFAKKANQMLMDYILARNHLIKKQILRNNFIAEHLRRKNVQYNKIHYTNVSGFNFSNKNMMFFVFVDSILNNSNFENSNLKGSIFSHVDLKNSNFTKANIQDVVWINVICPNGSNSEKNGGTCEGHL
jgi:hypothetical protein